MSTFTIVPFEDYVEYDYISQMMDTIKVDREKYEPNRSVLRVPWDKDDTEFFGDFTTQDGYLKYVEKEYMYLRTIYEHYKKLKK
jgi:hypothetical protein